MSTGWMRFIVFKPIIYLCALSFVSFVNGYGVYHLQYSIPIGEYIQFGAALWNPSPRCKPTHIEKGKKTAECINLHMYNEGYHLFKI